MFAADEAITDEVIETEAQHIASRLINKREEYSSDKEPAADYSNSEYQ